MSPAALKRQIAEKDLQIAEYTRMAVETNEEILALPEWSRGKYEKLSNRANGYEAVALKLDAEKRELERRLAALAVEV